MEPEVENAFILILAIIELNFDVIVNQHLILRMELQMLAVTARVIIAIEPIAIVHVVEVKGVIILLQPLISVFGHWVKV